MTKTVFLAATTALVCAAPAFAQVELTTTPFPDGTGSIGLARGWKLGGAYNGSVQCLGPNGFDPKTFP